MGTESKIFFILLACYLLGIFGIFLRASMKRKMPWLFVMFYILTFWPIIINLSSNRSLTYDQYTGFATLDVSEWSSVLALPAWLTTSVIVIYFIRCITNKNTKGYSRAGRSLLIAYFIFSSGVIIASLFGAPGGGFNQSLIRPLIVFTCMYFAVNDNSADVVRYIKLSCLVYIFGSLISIVIAPDWALFFSGRYDENPLFLNRLYGISSNPNALAPIALVFLYLEYYEPSKKMLRIFGSSAAILVILLAQSKTIWGAAFIGAAIVCFYGNSNSIQNIKSWSTMKMAVLILTISLTFTISFLIIKKSNINDITLTGRTVLWEIALSEWRQKPLFGYGPTLWDEKFRGEKLTLDATYAGQSHNMFVQQLAETGTIGFLLMLYYLVVFLKVSFKTYRYTKSVSIALASLVIIRCMTESALSNRNIDESMFINVSIFSLLVLFVIKDSKRKMSETCSAYYLP